MNRNVVLFCCLCLGASVLMLHFRPHIAKPVVASNWITPAPVANVSSGSDEPPVLESVLPKPSTPVVQTTEISSAVTESQVPRVDIPVSQNVVTQDKFAALRELSRLAARDPVAALAAALK